MVSAAWTCVFFICCDIECSCKMKLHLISPMDFWWNFTSLFSVKAFLWHNISNFRRQPENKDGPLACAIAQTMHHIERYSERKKILRIFTWTLTFYHQWLFRFRNKEAHILTTSPSTKTRLDSSHTIYCIENMDVVRAKLWIRRIFKNLGNSLSRIWGLGGHM